MYDVGRFTSLLIGHSLQTNQVSRKADGIRSWLFRREGPNVFLMSRDRIFKDIGDLAMPNWTILDVEHMENGEFLVFDILALDEAAVWYKSLQSRIKDMQRIESPVLKVKPYYPLTDTMALLKAQDTFVDFKTDGLVFTPNTSYMFDASVLLFKLQRPSELTFDFDESSLYPDGHSCSLYPREDISHTSLFFEIGEQEHALEIEGISMELFSHGGVAVCSFVPTIPHVLRRRETITLRFQHMRYDKLTGNATSTIASQLRLCLRPLNLTKLTPRLDGGVGEIPARSLAHPAKGVVNNFSFSRLQELLSSPEFKTNSLESSSLTVVNCTSRMSDPSGMARGLVIDAKFETVVAHSFPRFYHHQPEHIDASEVVCASVKMDGSMIVAYVYHGELYTNTKSRHETDQAAWARHWLLNNNSKTAMRDGFSYIFESIYRDNQIVLNYPYDRLVLLAVFDESGRELLNPFEKVSIAEAMKVLLVPQVYGTLHVLQKPKYLQAKEGWVAGNIDGDGALVRKKVISSEWIRKKLAVESFNPTLVWRTCAQRLGIVSISGIGHDLHMTVRAELPKEYRSAWDEMTSAFCTAYRTRLEEWKVSDRDLTRLEKCRAIVQQWDTYIDIDSDRDVTMLEEWRAIVEQWDIETSTPCPGEYLLYKILISKLCLLY